MTVDIERIKNKVRALLARNVKNGASVAEAEVCLEKAQKLLMEFNLDIEDLLKDTDPDTKKVIKEVIYENGNISPELKNLINAVAHLFDCDTVTSRKYVAGSIYRRVYINLIGNPINVEKVKYFIQLFEETRRKAIKAEGISGLRNINSFSRGFYNTLASKAWRLHDEKEAQRKKDEELGTDLKCTALITLDKNNVSDYIKQEYPSLKVSKISFANFGKATTPDAYNRGTSYGNTMNFSDAVSNNGKYLLK